MNDNRKNKGTESLNQAQYHQQPVYYLPTQLPTEDDEINLLDYWRILMRFKWFIIFTTLVGGGGTLYFAFQMTPIFRAQLTMAPVGEDKGTASALAGQFGGLASLAGINIGSGGGKTEEAIATLKSRAFTDTFIQEENLIPVLFEDIWDEENKTWKVESKKQIPTSWKAYKVFNGIRFISQDKESGMYNIAFEWKDPALAAQWANKMIGRINKYQKEIAIIEAKNNIEYLKNELKQTSIVEMRQSIFRLIEAQTKNIMLANVRDEYVFKVIDPAVIPEDKIKPKKKLMAILGTLVGFMIGVFLAFFIAFIKKQKELAKETLTDSVTTSGEEVKN